MVPDALVGTRTPFTIISGPSPHFSPSGAVGAAVSGVTPGIPTSDTSIGRFAGSNCSRSMLVLSGAK